MTAAFRVVIGALTIVCGLIQGVLAVFAAATPDGFAMTITLAAAAAAFVALGSWGVVAGIRE